MKNYSSQINQIRRDLLVQIEAEVIRQHNELTLPQNVYDFDPVVVMYSERFGVLCLEEVVRVEGKLYFTASGYDDYREQFAANDVSADTLADLVDKLNQYK